MELGIRNSNKLWQITKYWFIHKIVSWIRYRELYCIVGKVSLHSCLLQYLISIMNYENDVTNVCVQQ